MDDLFLKDIKKEKINSVLITQGAKRIFSYYKNKKQANKLHKINSCTKSIISILIGIAFDQKLLTSLDTPVHTFFPKIFETQSDKSKMDITIRHLITMTDGLDFPEFGEWDCFAPMVYHTDIVQFVINRRMLHTPGTHMNYNSGASHILSAIIQKVSGMKTEDFAKKHLFSHLGITEFRWYVDKMNINKGADGLVMKVNDMEKIGLMMLDRGMFGSKRILSEDWISDSTKPNLITYDFIGHYGKHWWCDDYKGIPVYFALGFGGQFIIIIPDLNITITVTSDIYEDSLKPMRIIKKHLSELVVA